VNSTTARAGSASSGTTATAELVTEQVPPIAVSDVLPQVMLTGNGMSTTVAASFAFGPLL
jgi:hypothetical protein